MNVIVHPSKVSGSVTAPPSKSYTHRALILASLSCGTSAITNYLQSEDTLVTLEALRNFGVSIEEKKGALVIGGTHGIFHLPKKEVTLDLASSGTSFRFFAALAALSDGNVYLTGSDRLKARPITPLLLALEQLGCRTKRTAEGIFIRGGTLVGGKINVDATESSQFLSALLLIAPYAARETIVTVTGISSAPYVAITLDLVRRFGGNIQRSGDSFIIAPNQRYTAQNYSIEGDYSSSSYFFAAAAIENTEIEVKNLNPESAQGDRYFLEILRSMKNTDAALGAIDIDMGRYPDLVPAVAIVASYAKGTSILRNIAHLRGKETDRLSALARELSKMGVRINQKKDALEITGGTLKGATIETYADHRIAMCMAIAALHAQGPTVITNAQVVAKSYPLFWDDLQSVGGTIKKEDTI